MTLSGNLGFVPIDEILRLLTRSGQQGAVEVAGNGLRGRVFVGKGGIDLATTSEDADLHRHLVNSGYSDENSLRRVTSGETTLAAIAESNQAIVDLIREMTVESLYQISHRGDEFEVHEGAISQYASPKSFELEALLSDASDREKEWTNVSDVVPSVTGVISFRRDLGEREEVAVKHDDWKVLSEIGTGASIAEIADHLGTTEFWTARVAARLVKSDLIELGSTTSSVAPAASPESDWSAPVDDKAVAGAESDWSAPVDNDASTMEEAQYEEDSYETPAVAQEARGELEADSEPAAEDVFVGQESSADSEEGAHDSSWWQEPKGEETTEDQGPQTPEVVGENLSEMPSVADHSDTNDEDVEEDTEAFLEKVFSELESTEPEAEEGHGLLRRRRMGTLRDFSSDS